MSDPHDQVDHSHAEWFRVLRMILWIAGLCAFLVFLQFPLRSVEHMVEAVAGKKTTTDTSIKLNMTVRFGLTIALGTGGLMWRKMRRQRGQLLDARRRITDLEERVVELLRRNKELEAGG